MADEFESLSRSTNRVNAWTEWGRLNEIVVGRADGACYPQQEPNWRFTWLDPKIRQAAPFPVGPKLKHVIKTANEELDGMVALLEGEGVVVHRTKSTDFGKRVNAPDWEVPCGFTNTCPRDTVITIGNVIMEATMSRRARYFEYLGTRDIVHHLYEKDPNMLWKAGPRPSMNDSMYDVSFWEQEKERRKERKEKGIYRYALTEKEPCFDAADMTRMGEDVIIQHSAVSNMAGINWLKRELKGHVNFHVIHSPEENTPVHVDCTLVPIRPPSAGSRGIMMYCPDPRRKLVDRELQLFKDSGFDLLPAPEPSTVNDHMPVMCEYGKWLSMNLLQIAPNKIIIEENEASLRTFLEEHGFEVLQLPYRNVYEFGGSLHCSTWDINRDDEKKSWLKRDNQGEPEHVR